MNLRNKKGWKHGYCKLKNSKGNSWAKYTLNNGTYFGYEECYDLWFNGNGKIDCKGICI